MNIDFFNPVKIISGTDCFKNFTGFAAFGKKCVIVTGKNSAKQCGALDDAVYALENAGISYKIFNKIEQNPLMETCYEGGKFTRKFGADFVIGIGGGSPLDAAKSICIYAANPRFKPADIFENSRKPAIPMLAVNTTAGTGSEVTPYSILTVHEIKNKKSVSGDDIYPKIAFLDPKYTETLSKEFTAATAIDALCHAVEGFFGARSNEISDSLAIRAIPMLVNGLRAVSANNITPFIREELLYASTIAGQVISRTGTGFVHSTGYALTYNHNIPHGEANGYFLPDFVSFMAKNEPEKGAVLFMLCDIEKGDDLMTLFKTLLPFDYKIDEATLKQYAKNTITAKNVKNSLAEIDEDYLTEVLLKRLCK